MITRDEIADLNDGDIVTVGGWQGLCVSGPVSLDEGAVWMGQYIALRYMPLDIQPDWTQQPDATLTVLKRAEPPLYVNHPRPTPVVGDVVRTSNPATTSNMMWAYDGGNGAAKWRGLGAGRTGYFKRGYLPTGLTLLVDGETGQVAQ